MKVGEQAAEGGPIVMVHGGAGGPGKRPERVAGTLKAAEVGWVVLRDGGTALDAVEAATRVMESDPYFNAGYGSTLTRDGTAELDAIVMDGSTLDFGAVAVVRNVRHTVSLARRVLELTPHSMLAGAAAEDLARELGLNVPDDQVIAPDAMARWRRRSAPTSDPSGANDSGGQALGRASISAAPASLDTVGAVALDRAGHVAAATSTGGVAGKWPGRIGDSPIAGAGAYADDGAGAVSCTGEGEHIMRVCLAHTAWGFLRSGAGAATAARAALEVLDERTPGLAGLIVVDGRSALGWAFNTAAMPVAWRSAAGSGSCFDAP